MQEVRYAGFFIRLCANMIDTLIFSLVMGFLILIILLSFKSFMIEKIGEPKVISSSGGFIEIEKSVSTTVDKNIIDAFNKENKNSVIINDKNGKFAYYFYTMRDDKKQIYKIEGSILSTLQVIVLILFILTVTVFSISSWHGTPGKRLLGIQIEMDDGSEINFKAAFLRALLVNLSFMFFGILFITIPFREDRKGIHDIMCRTRVVYYK